MDYSKRAIRSVNLRGLRVSQGIASGDIEIALESIDGPDRDGPRVAIGIGIEANPSSSYADIEAGLLNAAAAFLQRLAAASGGDLLSQFRATEERWSKPFELDLASKSPDG